MSDTESTDPQVIEAELVDDGTVPPTIPVTGYSDAGVPSFDYVRERIEGRITTSIGSTELADATPQARSIDEQMAEREKAGRDKLAEIRKAMRGE